MLQCWERYKGCKCIGLTFYDIGANEPKFTVELYGVILYYKGRGSNTHTYNLI